MADLSRIVEKLNGFLKAQGLEPMTGVPQGLEDLLSSVLQNVAKHPDVRQRENITFAVLRELKKLFGGKNIEDAYTRLLKQRESTAAETKAASDQRAEEKRKQDHNYVPSFDELFGK